jgi:hypothetical protein
MGQQFGTSGTDKTTRVMEAGFRGRPRARSSDSVPGDNLPQLLAHLEEWCIRTDGAYVNQLTTAAMTPPSRAPVRIASGNDEVRPVLDPTGPLTGQAVRELQWAYNTACLIEGAVNGTRPPSLPWNDPILPGDATRFLRALIGWTEGISKSIHAHPTGAAGAPARRVGRGDESDPASDTDCDDDAGELHAKLAGLPDRAKTAYLQFETIARDSDDPTDKGVYQKVKDRFPGMDLLEFETWARYLRIARSHLGTRKHNRRTPPGELRSVVRPDQLD